MKRWQRRRARRHGAETNGFLGWRITSSEPRVWKVGDTKPLYNPVVIDRFGRGFRWDTTLMCWIHEKAIPAHERRPGPSGERPATPRIETSCPDWESLLRQHGPRTEQGTRNNRTIIGWQEAVQRCR